MLRCKAHCYKLSIDFNHQSIPFSLSWWTFLLFRFSYMLALINLHVSHLHQEYIAERHLRYWIVTVVLAVTISTILLYIPAILDLSSEEKAQSHVSQILIGLHLLNVKVSADYIILLSIEFCWCKHLSLCSHNKFQHVQIERKYTTYFYLLFMNTKGPGIGKIWECDDPVCKFWLQDSMILKTVDQILSPQLSCINRTL